MTKKHKIILIISILLFIIPEILWNPISNFVSIFLTGNTIRNNFIMNYDNRDYLLISLFTQLIGLVIVLRLYLINKNRLLKNFSSIIIFFLSIMLLITFFILYVVFAGSNISF